MANSVRQEIPLKQTICKKNVREDFGNDEERAGLEKTLQAVGLRQPILVYREGINFVVIDGERRVRAERSRGQETIPAIVFDDPLSPEEAALWQLVTNIQRKNLSKLEIGKAVDARMKSTGFSASAIASELGMSNSDVTRCLSLLTLPPELQTKIAAGEISSTAGYELSQIKDPQERDRLAVQAASGQLTRDALTGKRKAAKRAAAANSDGTQARALARLPGGKSVTVAAPGLTLESFGATLEELIARFRAARTKGLTLPTLLRVLADEAKGNKAKA